MSLIEVTEGTGPLVLGLPHTGTLIPDDCMERLNDTGRAMADTDWHIDKLYAGLAGGVSTVRTTVHRYVIDANRDPSGESLYPGQNTTGLCPLTDFDGRPIYRTGQEPDAAEVDAAAQRHFSRALPCGAGRRTLEHARAAHGFAILYDCHSIRSNIPFLFDGTLPDFNIGTNMGTTCAPTLKSRHARLLQAAEYTHSSMAASKAAGQRAITAPNEGCHAIQMELAQSTYMTEAPPWAMPAKRAPIAACPSNHLEILSDWSPT